MFNPTIEKAQSIPEKYLNMTTEQLENKIKTIKEALGERLFMPTHHYQKMK